MPSTARPIPDLQASAGGVFGSYGPQDAGVTLVQTFGAYEAEYAAIRRGVGILHEPQRGILRLTGRDRLDFLHRLTTADCRNRAGGSTFRALQLNDKGRIVADLLIHHGESDTWLDLDRSDIAPLRQLLEGRLFGEDLTFADQTGPSVAVALHGPSAGALLGLVAEGGGAAAWDSPGTHHVLGVAGVPVTAYRHDPCGRGSPGLRLLAPAERAAEVYAALADAVGGLNPDPAAPAPPAAGGASRTPRAGPRGRGVGWLAYNTARIEAGTPLFHVDFGPDGLPHELGRAVLQQAVSFTKGCYLGQEIVARMENLGHPKRVLVGLRCPDDRLPLAGNEVLDAGNAPVGSITSSTLAPLLGNVAIALAFVRWGLHEPGTKLRVPAEGALVEATVQLPGFV